MGISAPDALIEVRMAVAVSRTFAVHATEQHPGMTTPGQLGELVDGRDEQARRQAVDLLVDVRIGKPSPSDFRLENGQASLPSARGQ